MPSTAWNWQKTLLAMFRQAKRLRRTRYSHCEIFTATQNRLLVRHLTCEERRRRASCSGMAEGRMVKTRLGIEWNIKAAYMTSGSTLSLFVCQTFIVSSFLASGPSARNL